MNKQRVLFLCRHNSARSQIAQAILRATAGGRFEIASAGTEATGIHPLAVKAMADLHGLARPAPFLAPHRSGMLEVDWAVEKPPVVAALRGYFD